MTRSRQLWNVSFLGLLAISACGKSESGPAVHDEVITTAVTRRTLLLFVIDDMPASADLRERFANDFRAQYGNSPCSLSDPSAAVPIDEQAVVVFPSFTAGQWADAANNSALLYRTEERTEEALAAWTGAVASAITSVPKGEAPGTFQPLNGLATALNLIAGVQVPMNDEERRLQEATAGVQVLAISVVLGHEDESADPPENYAVSSSLGAIPEVTLSATVLPATSPGSCRSGARETSPRLQAWVTSLSAASPLTWAPGDDCSLWPSAQASCAARCFDRSPRVNADGSVACHVYAETKSDCAAERGWMRAMDVPASLNLEASKACEVQQLVGNDLDKCRNDLVCEGCAPGFCVATTDELASECTAVGKLPLPRFVGPSGGFGSGTRLHIVCEP